MISNNDHEINHYFKELERAGISAQTSCRHMEGEDGAAEEREGEEVRYPWLRQ